MIKLVRRIGQQNTLPMTSVVVISTPLIVTSISTTDQIEIERAPITRDLSRSYKRNDERPENPLIILVSIITPTQLNQVNLCQEIYRRQLSFRFSQ